MFICVRRPKRSARDSKCQGFWLIHVMGSMNHLYWLNLSKKFLFFLRFVLSKQKRFFNHFNLKLIAAWHNSCVVRMRKKEHGIGFVEYSKKNPAINRNLVWTFSIFLVCLAIYVPPMFKCVSEYFKENTLMTDNVIFFEKTHFKVQIENKTRRKNHIWTFLIDCFFSASLFLLVVPMFKVDVFFFYIYPNVVASISFW